MIRMNRIYHDDNSAMTIMVESGRRRRPGRACWRQESHIYNFDNNNNDNNNYKKKKKKKNNILTMFVI
jgi:Zn-finger nucleic acid-binding protein